ncbi:hypothetical protein OSCT_2377 [Oscillochloris trichoides DG-6]|uniref:Uncharacterized protein n=1 Tax=Oscillochloris trichoides DG-6 TaxID=765420 RepID=E1IGC6_9CHLR|nr:hypothetical protein OSCT_2377 [Oscillochloris trichoides DG-6]
MPLLPPPMGITTKPPRYAGDDDFQRWFWASGKLHSPTTKPPRYAGDDDSPLRPDVGREQSATTKPPRSQGMMTWTELDPPWASPATTKPPRYAGDDDSHVSSTPLVI